MVFIDFETAMLVFNDLQRIEIYDMEHSMKEDRYNTIGMVNDILFVVYHRTERKHTSNIGKTCHQNRKEHLL